MLIVRFLVALLLISLGAMPAVAEPLAKFSFGSWLGQAHGGPMGLSSCSVSRMHGGENVGLMLQLARDGRLRAHVISREWHLTVGEKHQLDFQIGSWWLHTATATARSNAALVAPLPNRALRLLRIGGTLEIRGAQGVWQFSLTEAEHALYGLESCVNRYAARPAEPIVRPSHPEAPVGTVSVLPQGRARIDAAEFASFMKEAGLTDYSKIDDLAGNGLGWAHFGWRTGPAFGGYFDMRVDYPNKSLEELTGDFMEVVLGACEGRSVSEPPVEEPLDEVILSHAAWACTEGDKLGFFHVTFVLNTTHKVFMVFMHLSDQEGVDAATVANGRIVRHLYRLFARR